MSLKLAILMALLSCAAVKAQCPAGLEEGQAKCDSCFGYTSCVRGAPVTTDCSAGTACNQSEDTNAACVNVANNSYECVTCPAGSPTTCDPFDPYQVVACVPGQAPIQMTLCDPALGEICQNGVCVAGTTLAPDLSGTPNEQCSAEPGDPEVAVYITYKPECTSGLLCYEGESQYIFNCTEGQYFDQATSNCQSLPVNSCVGQLDGIAPSLTDCSKYVACKGGEQIVEYDCDPPGTVYDQTTFSCVERTDDFPCPDLDGCTFESDGSGGSSETTTAESGGCGTTTSSSTPKPEECTADNVNERYPVEGDCKSYWACRKMLNGTYAYIKSQCSRSLVFNPETTFCDLPENVPGCEERNARLSLESSRRSHQHQASDTSSLSSE